MVKRSHFGELVHDNQYGVAFRLGQFHYKSKGYARLGPGKDLEWHQDVKGQLRGFLFEHMCCRTYKEPYIILHLWPPE